MKSHQELIDYAESLAKDYFGKFRIGFNQDKFISYGKTLTWSRTFEDFSENRYLKGNIYVIHYCNTIDKLFTP